MESIFRVHLAWELLVSSGLLITGVLSDEVFPIQGPSNTIGIVGRNTTLTCSIQGYVDPVYWWEYPDGSSTPAIVAAGESIINIKHQGSVVITGKSNLRFIGTPLDLAGKYCCGTIGKEVLRFAYLAVVGMPTCTDYVPSGGPAVESKDVILICNFHCSGSYRPRLEWFNSNTSTIFPTSQTPLDGSTCSVRGQAVIKPNVSDNNAHMMCRAVFPSLSELSWPNDTQHDQTVPEYDGTCGRLLNVLYSVRDVSITPSATGDVITCSANGNPDPQVRWYLIDGNATSTNDTSTKRSLTVTADMVGSTYMCIAFNVIQGILHQDGATYYISARPTASPPAVGAIVGGVMGGLVFVILVIVIVVLVCRRRQTSDNHKRAGSVMDDMKSRQQAFNDYMMTKPIRFFNKHVLRRSDLPEQTDQSGNPEEGIGSVCPWELPRENLNMVKKLGEGSFGQVWKSEAWKIPQLAGHTNVAVKMLKENASDKDKQDLLAELQVMKNLPEHPNVVSLLGCCTMKDPIMIVVEFVPYGNLKDYLQARRPHNNRAEEEYSSREQIVDVLGPRDLILFAYQCAKGMAHISEHKLLHRDLAARNILVGEARTCKVSDFGFARDVIDRNIYHRESQGPLPIRWMAPESIYDNVYTTQSDVWAFGVLLWEILTLGANPYPGMSGREVMDMIRKGERMERPEHCSDDVYDIALTCWHEDPESRPTFGELTCTLDAMLQVESDYLCLDDLQEDLYMNVDTIRGTQERI